MKILCVSDQIDPLIYTSSIKQRHSDVDFVISAGDLPMDYLDFIISTLNKPLFFVLGNHHVDEFTQNNPGLGNDFNYCGATFVESKIRHESGFLVAGLGGCMRYNRGENQFTNFEMNIRILKLIPALVFNRLFRGRFLDILLTHASPRGIHDREDKCHQGFKCFLWFMRIFKPRFLVHGHIHLYDLSEVRATKYCDTMVINAYSHYVLDAGETA
jgi:Icc-related predicted phosphoesterase